MTVRHHLDLTRRLEAAGIRAELVPMDGAVERLREVKDAWEVATLREAGRRLSDVAKCIIPKALAGSPERDLAAIIEWELRRKGFDKPAFDTIVASGPNAAIPHHRAGDRQLADGDLVVIDFGGMFHGYAVDMTRTVILGAASPRQRTCWDAVASAQRAAFEAATVGTAAEDVDAAARRCWSRKVWGRRSGTVWATGSDWTCTSGPDCRVGERASHRARCRPAWCSRSSPVSTFRAGAVCESRTTCCRPRRGPSG